MQKKITKQVVDNLQPPAKGETCVWDTEVPGFGVRVQAGGKKVYLVRYRTKADKPVERKMTLCRTTDAPPDKARQMARDVFATVAAGGDPVGDRKPKSDKGPTLEAMFTARVASMRSKGRAMATEVERVLLKAKINAADVIGRDRAPASVTPADIVKFVAMHYSAGNRGAADKARSYLAAAFQWAIKSANDYTVADDQRQDWGLTVNPAASLARDEGAIGVRDRALSADELRVFWQACTDGNAGFSVSVQGILKLMMACGQRLQETMRVDGSEIDLNARVWTMPAHKTKGGKHKHVIPLPDIILPELHKLKELHGDGPLFPPKHESGSERLTPLAVANAVRAYVRADDCEVQPFQPRDIRRTWKSRAHDAGVDRFTRDLIQQHTLAGIASKVYDRAEYFPQMRAAMDAWDKWLQATIAPTQEPVALAA